ncbi:MAG: adenosylcobinamide-phosphate synthase CbiB [Alphaproteobacteria bacterium]
MPLADIFLATITDDIAKRANWLSLALLLELLLTSFYHIITHHPIFYNRFSKNIIKYIIPHPVVIIGWWLLWLEKILYPKKTAKKILPFCLGGFYVLLAILPIILLIMIDDKINIWLNIIILATMLASGSLLWHVADVARGLKQNLTTAQIFLQKIVSRDTKKLSRHGVARSTLESLSENFSDAIIAPSCFYLLFGLWGVVFYKIINTADSMVGYRNKRYFYFGKCTARLDDIINFLPARLSAFFYLLAGLFYAPKNFLSAIIITLRHAKTHSSPNSGWPEAALSGIMNITIGGTRFYSGGIVKKSTIGIGRANLTQHDIYRGIVLTTLALGIFLLLLFIMGKNIFI